ncbi:PAS domain S-box protein, partial [bacterium]|nr:PAS domain S-box protein [bacterium]
GYSEKELISGKSSWNNIIHPEDRDAMISAFREKARTSPDFTDSREYRIIGKDGRIRFLNEQIQCSSDLKGSPCVIKGIVFEVSDETNQQSKTLSSESAQNIESRYSEFALKKESQKRRRAEAEFLKEKDFLETILDSFTYPFYVIDANTYQIRLANKTAKDLYGQQSNTCYQLSHQRNTPCDKSCVCPLKIVKETKKPCFAEHIHYDQEQNPHYFAVHGFPILDDKGEVSRIIEYSFEVTEQRKAEMALRESEEKYRLLFENERDAILLVDAESLDIVDANQTALDLYQYSKDVFLNMKATVVSADKSETISSIQEEITNKTYKTKQYLHRKKDGTVFPVETTLGFFDWKGRKTICSIVRDITEKREQEEHQSRLEKRLSTSQRLNAIGTLAGGIAHDFNNLLFAQIGYLEMTLSKLPEDHVCHNYVNESLKASFRAADLVKQILAFSRSDHVVTQPINIAPILKETVKLLESSVSSSIQIKTNINSNCHNVIGNPIQIQQLILNISANGEYAMKDTGGELYFELMEEQYTAKEAKAFGFDSPGTYVSMLISDTGIGMTPDIKEHIFEPYFTTKPHWQGGGMGMAVVHGIVENNMEGVISVDSEPENGTRIKIIFPALVEGKETPKSVFTKEKKKVLKNQVVVLFVDDEEVNCSMSNTILSNLGYHVITHTDPEEAINTFKKESQYIDLVITDHIMPGMTGIQMAREMSTIRPDIEIILMTADEVNMKEDNLRKIGILKLIPKPVSKHTLSKTISELRKNKPIRVS